MIDLFGTAILDFQTNNSSEDLVTETNISKPDLMRVAHLFRDFDSMPIVEQEALKLAEGKILDVGCGAGSHSLYLQNVLNLEVTSIDISENAIKTCQLRGLKNAKVADISSYENEKFDTILLMMNGTGIAGTLENFPKLLQKLKSLLLQNGQILMDSTDIFYMYDADDLEYLKQNDLYYGELEYTISYKSKTEVPFSWLYLHYKLLETIVLENNFQIQKIIECENHSYLVRLF